MTDRPLEPSTFALDAYFAAGGTGDPALDRHVAGCARCAAYMAELERLAREPWPVPLPDARPRPPFRARGLAPKLAALAAAAALFALWPSPAPRTEYVGSKSVPSVQVVIRSEGRSRPWDGKSPLHPGDAVALHADCEHFAHLSVAVLPRRAERGAWSRVFDGACPADSGLLPFSLVADETPGAERIAVVFSTRRLDDAALRRALQQRERGAAAWVTEITLQKQETAR